MDIKTDQITGLLKEQLEKYNNDIDVSEVGEIIESAFPHLGDTNLDMIESQATEGKHLQINRVMSSSENTTPFSFERRI